MIEVEVHQQLRAFLREQGEPYWPHHLTMARLVARALRIERSALIQAGAPSGYHGRYRLSYLMPLLIWQGSAVLVVPEAVQQRLLMVEIPRLKQWISTHKPIQTGDRWPGSDYQGLLITTPQHWLTNRLEGETRFPQGIPTVMDGVDYLEQWASDVLTATLQPQDWDWLMLARPEQAEMIRDVRVQLTRSVFQHPPNPYECYMVEQEVRDRMAQLWVMVSGIALTPEPEGSSPLQREDAIAAFPQPATMPALPSQWGRFFANLLTEDSLLWTQVMRQTGQFSVHCGPVDVSTSLSPVWEQQPIVLIGGALDQEPTAEIYRQRIGLNDATTCVKFSPDRQHEVIQLYLPDRLPMPNTPQFQPALLQELRQLLTATSSSQTGLAVVIVGDMPLKAQVGSVLAAEFGSRVQVEKTCLDDQGILVTGWEFWQQHQAVIPAPALLAIATLPIPSLEHPLVAGRVAYYKRQRLDWFRLYLLPEALSQLQRAIAPVREAQGIVALLDNRVNHRSYGQQVLAALSPHARINYVDPSLFSSINYFQVD